MYEHHGLNCASKLKKPLFSLSEGSHLARSTFLTSSLKYAHVSISVERMSVSGLFAGHELVPTSQDVVALPPRLAPL